MRAAETEASALVSDAVIIAPQGVGEPFRHGGVLTLLPEGHDEQLDSLPPADIDQIPSLEIADEQRAARIGLDAAGRVGADDAGGDLGLLVERSPDALTEALSRVIGHGDEHGQALTIQARSGEKRSRFARLSSG